MAFCSNCGTQVEGSKFCPSCGTPIGTNGAPASPYAPQPAGMNYAPQVNTKQAERQQSMEEMVRMINYFGQKKAQYDEYDAQNEEIARCSLGTRKPALVWGIILAAFGVIIGFSIMSSSVGAGFVFLLLCGGGGAGLIVLWANLNARRKRRLAAAEQRVVELADELTAHFNAYGYCPVGAEYTNPAILEGIQDVIRQGRASTPEMAINVMLDDVHKSNMELQAQMTTAAARQAASGATAAAVFSAASFFLG